MVLVFSGPIPRDASFSDVVRSAHRAASDALNSLDELGVITVGTELERGVIGLSEMIETSSDGPIVG